MAPAQNVILDDNVIEECITGNKANFENMHVESVTTRTRREWVTNLSFAECSVGDLSFIPVIFPKLTSFKLVNCQLEEEQLHELATLRLTILNISGCKLTRIPLRLLKPGLKALILSNNNIDLIPPLLESIPKGPRPVKTTYVLNTLILSKNPLTDASIKDNFSGFPSLRKINLSECELASCPQILSAAIREVRLSHNKISTIPESWICVSKLRHLELGHNQIAMIRDVSALSKSKWLHQLGLSGNPCMEREEVVSYLRKSLSAVNPHMRINQILVSDLTTQKPQ